MSPKRAWDGRKRKFFFKEEYQERIDRLMEIKGKG